MIYKVSNFEISFLALWKLESCFFFFFLMTRFLVLEFYFSRVLFLCNADSTDLCSLLSLPGTQYYIQLSNGDAYNGIFGECYIDLKL